MKKRFFLFGLNTFIVLAIHANGAEHFSANDAAPNEAKFNEKMIKGLQDVVNYAQEDYKKKSKEELLAEMGRVPAWLVTEYTTFIEEDPKAITTPLTRKDLLQLKRDIFFRLAIQAILINNILSK